MILPSPFRPFGLISRDYISVRWSLGGSSPLKIPKKEATLAFNGRTKSLTIADSLYRGSAENTLWVVTPINLPGWSILFRCSHSRNLTLLHLTLKMLLEDLNKNEKFVMTMLTIGLREPEYQVLELILSNYSKIKVLRSEILDECRHSSFLGIEDPLRQLRSFEPRLEISKMWTERAKLAPKRYIGVGYTDHGSISSTPSWKEQMIEDGEVRPRLGVLLFSLRRIFGLPLSLAPSSRGVARLKSSKRTKQGE